MAAVFAASAATAATGWYGAIDLGYHWPDQFEVTSSNNAANGQPYVWDLNQDNDWAAFGRLGYQMTPNFRAELELGHRVGDMQSIRGGTNQAIVGLCTPGIIRTAAAPNCGSPDGKITSWTIMANVIYDILPDSVINPFIGVGVGINRITINTDGQFSNITGPLTAANPAFQNLSIHDNDTAFAWQALAGLSWKATDDLSVDLTYRYLGGSDISVPSTGTASASRLATTASTARSIPRLISIGLEPAATLRRPSLTID